MVEIVQVSTEKQKGELRKLLREFVEWTQTFSEVKQEDTPTFAEFEQELANLPGKFAPEQGGGFYLAYIEGKLAGCVALLKVNSRTGEIKRMYVRPEFRGQKIGWQLTQHLIKQARAFEYEKLVLSSHITMKKAHSIYHAMGFKNVPAPDDFPEDLKPTVVFMEMRL